MNKTTFLIIWAIVLIAAFSGIYFFFIKPNIKSNNYQIQNMDIQILKEGTGAQAKNGDSVTVNYVGTLLDGTKFDSSIDRNEPFQFILGQNRVIQGWEIGVLGMKAGEKRKLTIPPELAYGNQAVGGVIPANSTLIFEIDLVSINSPAK